MYNYKSFHAVAPSRENASRNVAAQTQKSRSSAYAETYGRIVFAENKKSRHGCGDTHIGVIVENGFRGTGIKARKTRPDAGTGKVMA